MNLMVSTVATREFTMITSTLHTFSVHKNKQVNAKSCRVQKTRTLGTRLIRTTYALRAIYEIPEFPIDINMNEYIINNCTLNAHVRQTNHQKANVVRRQFLTLPNNIPKIRRHRSAMQTKNAMVMFGHN